jgi:hypothetical protein
LRGKVVNAVGDEESKVIDDPKHEMRTEKYVRVDKKLEKERKKKKKMKVVILLSFRLFK